MSTQKSEKEKKRDENYGKNYKNWRSRWRAAITARQPLTYWYLERQFNKTTPWQQDCWIGKIYLTGLTATVGAAVLGLTIAKWVLSSTSISWKGKQNDWVWFLWEISNKVTVVELRLASLISYVNVSRIGFLSLSPFRDVAKYILHFFHFTGAVLEKHWPWRNGNALHNLFPIRSQTEKKRQFRWHH